MELHHAPLSPYARKVRVIAQELGIEGRLHLVTTSPQDQALELVALNPLGKIPVLVVGDGLVIYDSRVICEYLMAEFGGGGLLAASGPQRWRALTTAALADGIADAAVLVRQERMRPEGQRSSEREERQLAKVKAGLDRLERQVPEFGTELDLGQIAVVCALGYAALRLGELDDLRPWPRLRAWYEEVSKRPSFAQTAPVA